VAIRGIHQWYIVEVPGGLHCITIWIWDDGRVVCIHYLVHYCAHFYRWDKLWGEKITNINTVP
jgi:hypothetical protein